MAWRTTRACALVAIVAAAAGCGRGRRDARDAAPAPRGPVWGQVTVDGRPQGRVSVVLAGADGRAVASTWADGEGRFELAAPAGAYDGGPRWVVAKLHDPVIGAAAAPWSTPSPIALAVAGDATATLDVIIELPPGADLDHSVELELTPDALVGLPDAATQTLPYDGTGGAVSAYHTTRVIGTRRRLRLMRGVYQLRASSIVDRGTTREPHPPDWIADHAIRADGTTVAAKGGTLHLAVDGDAALRVIMVPTD